MRQNDNNVEKRTFYHIKNLRQPNSSPCAPAKKQSVNLTITDCFLLFFELFELICFENGSSAKVFFLIFPLIGVVIGGLIWNLVGYKSSENP